MWLVTAGQSAEQREISRLRAELARVNSDRNSRCSRLAAHLRKAAGLTAVIAQWPPSLDLIRTAGAVYLLWMAHQVIRSLGVCRPTPPSRHSWILFSCT